MKQHPFMGKAVDAMYVEYTGTGATVRRARSKGRQEHRTTTAQWIRTNHARDRSL